MKFLLTQQNTLRNILLTLCVSALFLSLPFTAAAQFNPEINYQGKLTNAAGVAVPDGLYNMNFWLVPTDVGATSTAVWSEARTGGNRVEVVNGLFSVMLGEVSTLSSVDFNQTLYLGVEIGGVSTTTPAWDGEMSPRKVLGAVPAAFVAETAGSADALSGIASSSFLRSDEADTMTASSSSALLALVQNGVGKVLALFSGATEIFTALSNGNIGIGTINPSSRLDITNSATSSAILTLRDAVGDVSLEIRAGTSTLNNLFIGTDAGRFNTTGNDNVFLGDIAGSNNSIGRENTAIGYEVLASNTSGDGNAGLGAGALFTNSTGDDNTAVGARALYSNSTGSNNSAVGRQALYNNTTGINNVAFGRDALFRNTTGGGNAAFGRGSLLNNDIGDDNVAIGYFSLSSNTNGFSNIALGNNAGSLLNSGLDATSTNNSIFLGPDTRALGNFDTNSIVIGSGARGLGSNTAVLGNDSIITTALKGNVGIGSTTPTARLTVQGVSGSVADTFRVASSTGSTTLALLSNGDLELPGQFISAGIEWSPVNPGLPNFLNSVTYGNGVFVAVSLGSVALYSDNGVTWATTSLPSSGFRSSVTYGNGLFVAVGSGGDRVITSPDGITWTARTAAGNDDTWREVTYGNGLFVAVGSGTDRVMTSPDGINWTVRSAAGNDDSWTSVTYGNGLFVAVGNTDSGSDKVITSPDGVTWTARTAVGNNDSWTSVTYGNGLFVAVSSGGDRVMTSPDGITWTARTAVGNDDDWNSVTYGNGLFVAVGYYGDSIMTSPDGINWTGRDAYGYWQTVTYGNGLFVAMAYDATTPRAMVSGKINTTELATKNIFQGGLSVFDRLRVGTTTSAASLFVQSVAGLTPFTVASSTGASMLTLSQVGNFGIGSSSPSSLLTVAGNTYIGGDLRLVGGLRDGANATGTLGMMLQSTGTSTRWVATSTLGIGGGATTFLALTDTPSSYTANRIFYTNAGANAVVDSADFTYDGTNLGLGGDDGITIGGLRAFSASTSIGNYNIGWLAGDSETTGTYNVLLGQMAGRVIADGSFNNAIGGFALRNLVSGTSNNVFGYSAGFNLVSGSANSIFGDFAGNQLVDGVDNSFFGARAGEYAATSSDSVAVGAYAALGVSGYTASRFTVLGYGAGENMATGADNNILLGYRAADNLTTGNNNIIIGYDIDNVTATADNRLNIGNLIFGTGLDGTGTTLSSGNIGIGTSTPTSKLTVAGNIAVTGGIILGNEPDVTLSVRGDNLALGTYALGLASDFSNVYGNTAVGMSAGTALGYGWENVFMGALAGYETATTSGSVIIGSRAVSGASGVTDASDMVVIGARAGENITTGGRNTMIGQMAGFSVTTGSDNVLIGRQVADNLTTGWNNIVIGGYNLDVASTTQSNTLNIGNLLFGTGLDGTGTTLSSGNIGIGTTSPSAKLDVWGGLQVGTSSIPVLSVSAALNSVGILSTKTGANLNIGNGTGGGESIPTFVMYSPIDSGAGQDYGDPSALFRIDSISQGGGYFGGGANLQGISASNATAGLLLSGYQRTTGTVTVPTVVITGSKWNGASATASLSGNDVVLGIASSGNSSGDIATFRANGNVGFGTTTPASRLSVAGDLRLTGAFRDGANASGTLGMVLQSTGTSTRWVATSTLGIGGGATTFLALTDTPSSYTANRIFYTNAGASAVTDSANFTFDGTNLGLGAQSRIAFGGTNYLYASSTNDSIVFGENAGASFTNLTTRNVAIGFEAARYASSTGSDASIFIGELAGLNSVSTIGFNTYVGSEAGRSSNGYSNSFYGTSAGAGNVGNLNSFFGPSAGEVSNGSFNNIMGFEAGRYNVGSDNILIGTQAGVDQNSSYVNAIGYQAGYLNTGTSSNLIGYQAGFNNQGLSSNLFGVEAGRNNIGDYANLFGENAGYFNRGDDAIAIGRGAGYRNEADDTIAIGREAMGTTTASSTGIYNIAIGYRSLFNNTTGGFNTALGEATLLSNSTGGSNTAVGTEALRNNTTGGANTAMGQGALISNTTGSDNTAVGQGSMFNNTEGYNNAAFGNQSLSSNTTGYNNTALGWGALLSNTSGINNVAVGYDAASDITSGAFNTIIGYRAADNLTTGGQNIVIGYDIDISTSTASNQLNIGNLLFGTGLDGTGTTLASGNIGIGTTSPRAKLDVWGGFNVGTSSRSLISANTSANQVAFGTGSVTNDIFGNTPLMVLSGNGASLRPTLYLNEESTDAFSAGRISFGRSSIGGDRLIGALDFHNAAEISAVTDIGDEYAGSIRFSTNAPTAGPALSEHMRLTSTGNLGLGTTTPSSKLTVVGDMRLTGAFRDGANASGTLGMVLQSTGTSTRWVATSTLGISGGGASTFLALTDTPSSYTANRVMFTNGAATALIDSADFTFDGTNLGLGNGDGIALGGARMFTASTSGSIALGFNAGYHPGDDNFIAIGREAALNAGSSDRNIALGYRAARDLQAGSNFNVFVGYEAGATSTGARNIMLGLVSGAESVGDNNNFIGTDAGRLNQGSFNNFLGSAAGLHNTGGNNNFIGLEAGNFNNGTSSNIIGNRAGLTNTGSSTNLLGTLAGYANTGDYVDIIGTLAGYANTGDYNSFMGYSAGATTTGSYNLSFGYFAGASSSGTTNNLFGRQAGQLNTGSENNIFGYDAGRSNTGSVNNFFGTDAGNSNTGSRNNFFGLGAGYANSGDNNNYFGYDTGWLNNGDFNEMIGSETGRNVQGSNSVLIGAEAFRGGAGFDAFSATNNVAIGYRAGYNASTSADNNILLGYRAADNLTTGNNNIIIGYDIDNVTATADNRLNIGNLIFGTGLDGTGTTLSSGNIGIGTSTPGSKLSVAGDLRLTGAFRDGVNASGTLGMVLQSTGTSTRWVATSTLGISGGGGSLFTDGGATTYLTATGDNLAIGTTTAGSKLTVDGDIAVSGNINLAQNSRLNVAGERYIHAYTLDNTFGVNQFMGFQAGNFTSGSSTNQFFGIDNLGIGRVALSSLTEGSNNTAVGHMSLTSLTSGFANTAVGARTLLQTTTGGDNNAFGNESLYSNTTGYRNVALGNSAMYENETGDSNVSIGFRSLFNSVSGSSNVAVGAEALYTATAGGNNTGVGHFALRLATGDNNTALGAYAGSDITSGTSNTILGNYTGLGVTTGSNNTIIGANVTGLSSSLSNNIIIADGQGNRRINVNAIGNVGIGTTTPTARLALENLNFSSTTGAAGIDQYFSFNNSSNGATIYGNRAYIHATNTATTTVIGSILRVADSTTFGNTIRGLEVQADNGNNTRGENTGIAAFGRTFGVRGTTVGDAGGTFEPAGIYGETEGTTQGNAIRGYSSSITTAALLKLFQDTSAFTGTGLLMNFGNAGGSFSSTTASRFIDLQNAGSSRFTVGAYGMTTIGNGTTVNNAGLQIGYGGICVDNDGSCNASTTGRISAVSYHTGNSDLAETYFSSENLKTGEVVYLKGELSIGRASEDTEEKVIGVVTTKPGLLLGFDDESLRAGEEVYGVALAGRVPVRLSNENGEIKAGDELMLSSIPGVAMKASSTGTVVGIALEDFEENRAYSDTYINQFGDDLVDPVVTPINPNSDPRVNDGCYYGAGNASGDAPCVPLVGTTTDAQVVEAQALAEAEAQAAALEALKDVRSEVVTLENGETVRVGQVVMFVSLDKRYLDEDGIAMVAALLAAGEGAAEDNSADTIWNRLVTLANNFVDGVLSVFTLKADRVEVTEELCVDGVCLNANDIRQLLDGTTPSTSVEEEPEVTEEEDTGGGDESVPPVAEPEDETGSSTEEVIEEEDEGEGTEGETVEPGPEEIVEEEVVEESEDEEESETESGASTPVAESEPAAETPAS